MRFRAVLCALLAAVVAVTAVGPAVVYGQPGTDIDQAASPIDSADAATTIAIQPRPNGDARLRISTRFALTSTNETRAFRTIAREFEESANTDPIPTFRRAATAASNATRRPMNVTNVNRTATIVGRNNTSKNDTGRLVVAFTWTNFARQSDDELIVGDVFNTSQGTWLPSLTSEQTLRIETPRGHTIDTSPIGYTNRTLVWKGSRSFAPGEPRVIYDRTGAPLQPTTGENPNGSEDGNGDTGPFAAVPPLVVGAGAIVLGAGVVIVGAYTWTRRETDGDGDTPDVADDDSGSGTTPATAQTEAGTGASAVATADEPDDEPPDDELLSDEERVERLLERNDGRMKQASIVDETGWSNAKVSQLLSAMDDTGRIEKLRIGRENLISLPDRDDETV
ncbi:helix-turn-helix transcriptional regulator [Halococcus saccharolyticus]|uniref:HTH iclR-type domain-containing protein n=1 Tax=Halococcus saccharolyticus DSM 5350 TaxID=1227455 RepID=M0MAU7_9EURY|nr:hypothetical protein [Halococcus saccharolyticus]EMA42468.1 hypothetical protein C449_17137 [Halococcus saccharolyticus DSM 5350]